MRSRLQVRVHINRALRAATVEQKLDEIALAIAELARYIEDIEKDKLNRSSTALTAQHGPVSPPPPFGGKRTISAEF